MLRDLFIEFIELSKGLRPDYPDSLGKATIDWYDVFSKSYVIPELFEVIYSNVQGTKRSIKYQRLMDFIPGYRLIHINELIGEKRNMVNILSDRSEISLVLPLLANYSSDFICYVENINGESQICVLLHDERELNLIYRTPEKFLETIIEFYKQNVYFLDDEGYLDYDWEKEGIIGSILNSGVKYWT